MNRLSIGIKLLLLAGVPVLGALILALLIAQGARSQAAAAAALGSVEDVAHLSVRISDALHALALERARVAFAEGVRAKPEAAAGDRLKAEGTLAAQFEATDAALAALDRFLDGRDLSRLPARLAHDLGDARTQLADRSKFRARVRDEEVSLDDIFAFYDKATDALVHATASLTQLSDDGELLRPISSLVALGQLSERESREHALLGYVFTSTQFPPGSFKTLVTLVTEQAIYADAFRSNAADARVREYEAAQGSPESAAAVDLRDKALATTDDVLSFDAAKWFEVEGARLVQLQKIEGEIIGAVTSAATSKMNAIRTSIRTSIGLSVFVLLASALLAWTIARGVTRTVVDLSSAAALVRRNKDYSVRARKTSSDELGTLTDAFNEMLSDIQVRDRELNEHRNNLEATVAARTAELSSRNEAMRLVLDNVDQGLATVRLDGRMDRERSRAFDVLFGTSNDAAHFADRVAGGNANLRLTLALGWEQLLEDFLPMEMTLEQLPHRIEREGTYITLDYRPILPGGKLDGVLLIASDVTAEVAARQEQERQREYVTVFERIMRDRDGFVEFATEIDRQLERLGDGAVDVAERMRLLHTVKGNSAQWGVASVAKVAHELESKAAAGEVTLSDGDLGLLGEAWEAACGRYRPLLGESGTRLAITRAEMDGIVSEIHARVPHEELLRRVERLRHEPAATRFERMAADLERLADRLHKAKPKVVIEANDVRLPASRFAPFWQSTVHVLRNMMDHGIEPADERVRAGKPEAGTVTLRTTVTRDHFRIEFGDDGRGIDWKAVAEKTAAAGLPAKTREDLERGLFAAGVSTAASITDVSGRGVGLSSVEERCRALGGTVHVESEPGKGSLFSFVFPRKPNENSIRPEAFAAAAQAAASHSRPPTN